jgi:hypothetical protein
MDLELRDAFLVEEQEHGLRPTNGQDLSSELDIAHTRVDKISDKHTAEAG